MAMGHSHFRRPSIWIGLAVLWLGGTAAGLGALADYANRPGAPAHAPANWPSSSRLTLDGQHPTLVMLVHPKCDCTRASLAELAELMARAPHRSHAYVVFLKPAGVADDWEHTDLWEGVKRIPDVTAVVDDEGREAERFGGETSGQALLYDTRGRLLFAGGTTVARGHEGDSAGLAAILALLNEGQATQTSAPVFGCPLFDANHQESERKKTAL